MNVNPLSSYNAYAASVRKTGRSAMPAKGPAAESKGDTIAIDVEAVSQKEISRISKGVAQEVRRPTDPARLESIRQAVADNSYYVESDKLAEAILSRAAGV